MTRLSSGMTAAEASARAALWWDGKGRFLMAKKFNRVHQAPKNGRGFTIKGGTTDVVPSGIMRGDAWSLLTQREQANIVQMWHHFHVVMKDIENPAINADLRDTKRRLKIQ